MLGNKDAMATIAVKDLEVASRFYEGTLGLKRAATEGDGASSTGAESPRSWSTSPSTPGRTGPRQQPGASGTTWRTS